MNPSSGSGNTDVTQEWKARDAAQAVVDRGREAADAVQRTADNAYDTAKRTVQDQPALTMLGVFAFGVVLGAVLMSGTRRSNSDRLMDYLYDHAPSQSQLRDWRRRFF
jgi:hypothetical protein